MKKMMAKGGSTFSLPLSRSGVKQVLKKAATAAGKQANSMKKTTMKTGGMINPNPSTKVSPNTPKMKKGGMAKAMYGKTMMRNGGAKKK